LYVRDILIKRFTIGINLDVYAVIHSMEVLYKLWKIKKVKGMKSIKEKAGLV